LHPNVFMQNVAALRPAPDVPVPLPQGFDFGVKSPSSERSHALIPAGAQRGL
jgi:hypothetical protein